MASLIPHRLTSVYDDVNIDLGRAEARGWSSSFYRLASVYLDAVSNVEISTHISSALYTALR